MTPIIRFSLEHKKLILLFTAILVLVGTYSAFQLPIGVVPDITNNQVQVITTSRKLSTLDVERYLTQPLELEMANLPGLVEMRSVSKFGLSVITLVFNDEMGHYLPRQLVSEKLKTAQENIPEGFGNPSMGPITTGLGEIYQYTLETTPEYQGQYSLSELRTLHDWQIRKQLSGIQGVVEVNTWGGQLKQYELQVDPLRLKALNVSIQEIFEALQKNNAIEGGGYIEKNQQAYFIRAQGIMLSANDIAITPIRLVNGIPLLIRDVGEVKDGYATRFGAITANGQGEKVMGQIMMLKGADSKRVSRLVEKRLQALQQALPQGVRINPFLKRSDLVQRTTHTVVENLILGSLIVIFVVVLLLGNWRSGFVVASVIPLSLLFAITGMYLFKIDANLMSLGAIDFGIIIDGAVIIVEYTSAQLLLGMRDFDHKTYSFQKLRNEISLNSSSKMMNSALFGQLIILIVFLPILALPGIEGKMFKPMAIVFSMALLGAMLLCFTYVPVVSSLVLKPEKQFRFSLKLMGFLEALYLKTIGMAFKHIRPILASAIALLITGTILFLRLGGEFVPTLDEGDFVIQPVLKTGTSLQRTIEITTEIEKILGAFPEVEQVVSRIGAAEIPTDPMSMEQSDIIIKLKSPSHWQTASTKDELADAFKQALAIIPNVEFEFTQPIEMRFNELITGTRGDLAIKIFGENLDTLHLQASKVERILKSIKGAADVTVEKTEGLPQIAITYKRDVLAKYGLSVQQVNQLIEMGYGGAPAGKIYEGEKAFDLVLRYLPNIRQNPSELYNISIPINQTHALPLSQLANIEFKQGPAQISRDNGQRRVVVNVNVRGRDLQSVVNETRTVVESSLKLPPGYTIAYGGQFENLQNAQNQLMWALPLALFLIFSILYFAFRNWSDAFLIFSAIPMAGLGGIFLLVLRGMPFSISAGVGFIALFGIAVLNGLVLIEHLKQLKTISKSFIAEAAMQRLRPVLLTAFSAALGFLPMALSQSAGAEIQRPLATVVIGGLVSATFLTLVLLPLLYYVREQNRLKIKTKKPL